MHPPLAPALLQLFSTLLNKYGSCDPQDKAQRSLKMVAGMFRSLGTRPVACELHKPSQNLRFGRLRLQVLVVQASLHPQVTSCRTVREPAALPMGGFDPTFLSTIQITIPVIFSTERRNTKLRFEPQVAPSRSRRHECLCAHIKRKIDRSQVLQ